MKHENQLTYLCIHVIIMCKSMMRTVTLYLLLKASRRWWKVDIMFKVNNTLRDGRNFT